MYSVQSSKSFLVGHRHVEIITSGKERNEILDNISDRTYKQGQIWLVSLLFKIRWNKPYHSYSLLNWFICWPSNESMQRFIFPRIDLSSLSSLLKNIISGKKIIVKYSRLIFQVVPCCGHYWFEISMVRLCSASSHSVFLQAWRKYWVKLKLHTH